MSDSIPQDTPLKRCSGCGECKPFAAFSKNRSHPPDYLQHECKQCNKQRNDIKRALNPKVEKVAPLSKACNQCSEIKPNTAEFFQKQKRKNGTYGLTAVCKKCLGEKNKRWHQEHQEHLRLYNIANREKIAQRQRQYRQEHKEQYAARLRRYRQLYPERFKTYARTHYTLHRQRVLDARKEYRERNAEQVKTGKHNYQITHRAYLREYNRKYRAINRDKERARWHRKRARIRQIGGTYTAEDIRQQYKRQKGRCYYCHGKLTNYQIDHSIPISRPGSSNAPWNLVLACPTCNNRKRNKLPHEWPEGNRLL